MQWSMKPFFRFFSWDWNLSRKKGLFRHTPTLFHFSEFFRKKRRLYVGRASPAVSLSVKEKFSEPLNQLQIDRWVECLIEKVLFFVKTNGKFLYQTREQPSSSFDLPPPFYQESCTLWSSWKLSDSQFCQSSSSNTSNKMDKCLVSKVYRTTMIL